MSDFTPIDVFNKPFTECYSWLRPDILRFLAGVRDKPEDYGVKDQNVINDIRELYPLIEGLSDYADPSKRTLYSEPKPPQQVLRREDQASPSGLALTPTSKIHWTGNDKKEEFYILFDLLGVFISLIAPISSELKPTKPTAKNYFLPLVVLYGKWCSELASSNAKRPRIVQVTWFEKNKTFYPFFGASIQGYSGPRDAVKSKAWELTVQTARWNYLKVADMIPSAYPTFNDSPLRLAATKDGESGTLFGNCGETYPYFYILRDDPSLVKNSYGIAACLAGTFKKNSAYPPYDGKKIWEDKAAMWSPCDNCKELLKKYNVPLANFELFPPK